MPTAITAPYLQPLKDVAARLHVTPRRLREHLRTYPCGRKLGRQILFTDADFIGLFNSLECVGGGRAPYKPASRQSAAMALTLDAELQVALSLAREKRRQRPKR